MAKRKKPKKKEPEFPPPLNMADRLDDMMVLDSGCLAIGEAEGALGILTILTGIGHCDFIIDESSANEIIQGLRDFLAGDAEDFDP
jgi:hypothetical protein